LSTSLPALYIVGDIHGQFGRLVALLGRTGLIDPDRIWTGGLCVNCDGGLYQGGPGFIYRPPEPAATPD
jgi:hypothetical protein